MKKGLILVVALFCVSAIAAPSAFCGIRDCVKEKLAAIEDPTPSDISDATQTCMAEARDAADTDDDATTGISDRLADLRAKMAERRAEADKKREAAKEAAKKAMEEKMADAKAKMEDMAAFKACMEANEIDIENVTLTEVEDMAQACAIEAGLITQEQIDDAVAKVEAIKTKIEAAKTEAAEAKACISDAKETAGEDFDLKATLDLCLDLTAKKEAIKAKIGEMQDAREEAKTCIEGAIATFTEDMTREDKMAAIKACMPAIGE